MEKKICGKNQSEGTARAGASDPARKDRKQSLFARFEAGMIPLAGGEELSVLAALSGGADSTALLLLLHRYAALHGGRLEAMHVHHGIRGAEADRDAEASRALCERLGVPFHLAKVDVPALAAAQKRGLEEAARAARYAALNRVRAERGLRCLATGHNAEDQLETMIFQLCRGCSLKGLAGIPEKRGVILRPLLSFSKKELEDYCTENGVSFVYDSSNDDERFSRNKTRRQVIPALLEICPGALEAAGRLSRSLREDEELLASMAPKEDPLRLHAAGSLPSPLLRRGLAAAYARCAGDAASLESVHLDALVRLVRQGRNGNSLSLPGRIRARRAGDRLLFEKIDGKDGAKKLPQTLLHPGDNRFPDAGLVFSVFDARSISDFCAKNAKIHNLFTQVALNSATIVGDLTVRSRAAGDKIAFGGMTREISKLAAARTDDPRKRKTYPVVCDGDGPLWVPGYPPRRGTESTDAKDVIYIVMREDPV